MSRRVHAAMIVAGLWIAIGIADDEPSLRWGGIGLMALATWWAWRGRETDED